MTNAEAFKPVGTGVVALARTTGGSYTEEKQISPIPLHHSSTPSDLTSVSSISISTSYLSSSQLIILHL